VGLPNGGNHCCINATLQLLFNTPSWAKALKNTAELKPLIAAYEHGETSQLKMREIRQLFPLAEEDSLDGQQDAAAYTQAIGTTLPGIPQLSFDRAYLVDAKSIPRGSREPAAILALGIPSSSNEPFLEELLKPYFYGEISGRYDQKKDQIVESPGEITLERKTLKAPPDDLIIQVKRFGIRTPPPWGWFLALLQRFFGTQSSPSPFKIDTPVATPLLLKLRPEWISHQKDPVDYVCQGFVCHHGSGIHGGHYVAYVCKNSQWFECNDSVITPVSEELAQRELQKSYIISYRRKA
jgi:hypothetical protein